MTSPRDRRGRSQGSSTSFSEEDETKDRAAFLSSASSSSPFPSSPPFSSVLSYSPCYPPPPSGCVYCCVPRRVDCYVVSFRSSPRAPSELRPSFRCPRAAVPPRVLGILSREVDCCISRGAQGSGGDCRLWFSSQKTAAFGDGYQPVLAAGMIAAGVRHRPPPSGTRGLFNCRCCNVNQREKAARIKLETHSVNR